MARQVDAKLVLDNSGDGAILVSAQRARIAQQIYASAPAEPTTEHERQRAFFDTTGIWCTARARQRFERLFLSDRFTVRQVSLAWRLGALVWDQRAQALRVSGRRGDMTIAALGVLGGTAALVFGMYKSIMYTLANGLPGVAMFVGVTGAVAAAMAFVLHITLWPQQTALQVVHEQAGLPADSDEPDCRGPARTNPDARIATACKVDQ